MSEAYNEISATLDRTILSLQGLVKHMERDVARVGHVIDPHDPGQVEALEKEIKRLEGALVDRDVKVEHLKKIIVAKDRAIDHALRQLAVLKGQIEHML